MRKALTPHTLGPMTKRTIEQQINEANDRLSRLKARQKKVEVRQQIILGATVLAVARDSAENAKAVLGLLGQATLRDTEARDLAPVLDELRQIEGVVETASTDNGHSGG